MCKVFVAPVSIFVAVTLNVALPSALSRFLLTWLNILQMLMELALYGFWMQLRPVALSTLWSSIKLQQVNFMGKCKKYPRRRPLPFILGHHMVRVPDAALRMCRFPCGCWCAFVSALLLFVSHGWSHLGVRVTLRSTKMTRLVFYTLLTINICCHSLQGEITASPHQFIFIQSFHTDHFERKMRWNMILFFQILN